ncbi:hypothetical protein [Streptomyces sp. NPDC102437]|uniref:hypothetical protein n=1 Tax=Streptomyces sp. NPDC102437 TaxID=3366175 RepID=UPI0037F22B6D
MEDEAKQSEEVRRLVLAIEAFKDIEDIEVRVREVGKALSKMNGYTAVLRDLRAQDIQTMKQGKTWADVGRIFGISGARAQQIGSGVSGAQRRKKDEPDKERGRPGRPRKKKTEDPGA